MDLNDMTTHVALSTMFLNLKGFLSKRIKNFVLIMMACIFIGTWHIVLKIFAFSAIYFIARVFYRFVGYLLWLCILLTLLTQVHNEDTLLGWTLGFIFGVLCIVALNFFLDTSIHPMHFVVFGHLMLFLAGTHTKIDTMQAAALTANMTDTNSGLKHEILKCFTWGSVSGTIYAGIVDELTTDATLI